MATNDYVLRMLQTAINNSTTDDELDWLLRLYRARYEYVHGV
jgi:hypothetical protein